MPQNTPDPMTPPEVCPLCHGRGFVVIPDGGAGTARPCECRAQERARLLLARAGIPERYRRCRLANFQTTNRNRQIQDKLVRAQTLCQHYVDNFFDAAGEKRFRESGLLFIGPPGVGKTHLAAAVLTEIILRWQARGRFVDFTSLVHQIQSTFDPTSAESKQQVLDPVIEAEILVLDELGAQKPTEWVMNTLYLIMNTRYTRRLPTIFTTNFVLEDAEVPLPIAEGSGVSDREISQESVKNPRGTYRRAPAADAAIELLRAEPLAARISAVLVSRLCEMAIAVRLPDWDFRRKVMMHRLKPEG